MLRPHPDIAIIAIDDQDLKEIGVMALESRHACAADYRTLDRYAAQGIAVRYYFIGSFHAGSQRRQSLAAATLDNPWVVHSLFFKLDAMIRSWGLTCPMDSPPIPGDALGLYQRLSSMKTDVLRHARTLILHRKSHHAALCPLS